MSQDKWKSDEAGQEPELDHRIRDVIGKSLKAHFDDILAAPMPDRFLVLLAELETKENELSGKDQTNGRS
jgi:hypothetical protein